MSKDIRLPTSSVCAGQFTSWVRFPFNFVCLMNLLPRVACNLSSSWTKIQTPKQKVTRVRKLQYIYYLYEMKITKSITIHERLKRTLFIMIKTQQANFRRKPPFQPTKQQLNGEKRDVGYLSAFGSAVFCCGFFVCLVFV